ncbi:RagB/SusD family nutrient uptake outer membrane protein [Flavivirga spongiicola]|uniref:RagB/SusD family nutrient uptake outer membrane protein n=1 Tax=Flavivirga spongiicola TaxID=421621 RepID=A0ABU7XPD0_9FLAO|nr:RagB/SusD family nutrient uptake outer membrane protein [Flavivirga sp. MEBiC05379]MDO5977386.1 RagB/SusD family nutrient uptake outer membrane protein [Flavivirga sp. MEBiC05379]
MMNTKYKSILLMICIFIYASCDDVLDKENLSDAGPDLVWNDEVLANGFLSDIYSDNIDGWPTGAAGITDNDEGGGSLLYGELSPGSVGGNFISNSYEALRNIHILLENVGTGSISVEAQNLMRGQALFFRAKIYFELVNTFGGVPIILKVLDLNNDDLNIPRSKTSECIAQILTDLDEAITLLPDNYADQGADYGRITKGAAMAYKGRVLLHYASELFDPTQSAGRWQAAYDANKAALTYLEGQGKGLHPSYSGMWFDEGPGNPEAIMVTQYSVDAGHANDAGQRPWVVALGTGYYFNKGTIGLFDAYPMKDGKMINDPTSAYTYNSTAFWLNRDPRFTDTFSWNGDLWPLNTGSPTRTSDIQWSFQESRIESQGNGFITRSGLDTRKAVDGSIVDTEANSSPTDWMEIRFTEVLLNTIEAANEIGNTAEAYAALQDIRERAGVEAGGDGLYGLQVGMDVDQMRDAILLERRIELVFEGKRAQDLKRRRLYATVMNGNVRRGYVIKKTAAFDALEPANDNILDDRKILEGLVLSGTVDLNDPVDYNTYFTTTFRSIERLGSEIADGDTVNYLDHYYFRDIPQNDLDRNPALEQTEGWPNGTFNPLD